MNYFSHYYFDHSSSPEYNYGLLFPDFVRNFIPKAKLFENANLTSNVLFNNGISKHFYRDAVFHKSAVFEKMQSEIKPFIKTAFESMDVRRYFFVVHIFTEMLIDRVLLKENALLIDSMYKDIENTPNVIKSNWVEINYNEQLADFMHRLQRFQSVQYIKQYLNDNALAYSVNRVCMYVKVCNEWTINQTNEFLRIIEPCEMRIFENLNALKKEMAL